ncbi:receptor-like protein kinase ANXUR2 [Bidens hawaiensis]|uniref:receptor-like protein kinase ANXUR2 n=1 Tax=Bidens hawaiensis TaxID=980011 RepID=UPI00404B1AD5
MEIALLPKYNHKNIVSLLSFCDEDDEKILVTKYESNGSLDTHLHKEYLTWERRIQICLDAAYELNHVHHNDGSQPGIFHRDVKSANILLDENWNAKISDLGLSKVGPANTDDSFVFSNACGTPGYIAPEYYMNNHLTRKSDFYSFGVVMWEILCGRPAVVTSYKDDDRRSLTILAQKHYTKGTLYDIIPSHLRKQIKPAALNAYAKIAYNCLKNEEERPTMLEVVKELRGALSYQQVVAAAATVVRGGAVRQQVTGDGCVVGDGGGGCCGSDLSTEFDTDQVTHGAAENHPDEIRKPPCDNLFIARSGSENTVY